jgi:hypothetical protein
MHIAQRAKGGENNPHAWEQAYRTKMTRRLLRAHGISPSG